MPSKNFVGLASNLGAWFCKKLEVTCGVLGTCSQML
jgi:hypothetical protein